jgi:hypothetical protein
MRNSGLVMVFAKMLEGVFYAIGTKNLIPLRTHFLKR